MLKNKRGITLVALVVTIVVLIVLAGVSIIMIFGEEGIFSKTQIATDKYDVEEAKEKIELKKLEIQTKTLSEQNKIADLQDLVNGFCADNEVEYVKHGKKIAQLAPIDVTGYISILVKLKEYVYEFEIGREMQVAVMSDANGYAVTYNANGGKDSPNTEYKRPGIDLTLTTKIPTKRNCRFMGWATEPGGTIQYQPGEIYSTDADVTLYAVWKFYIYDNGNEYTDATGGFEFSIIHDNSYNPIQGSSCDWSKDDDTLYMWGTGISGRAHGLVKLTTKNEVDLSNYKTMYVDMDYFAFRPGQTWRSNVDYGLEGVNIITITGGGSSTGTTIEIPINNPTGTHKPYFAVRTYQAGGNVWMRIRAIYFI